ncbi:MAG: ABC transporter permease [Bacteroidales bacterium]|nr:ABC transporter permease [Bacteroidales bacterium]
MNLPFYIAKRYLISKKSHNIINIISGISVIGITIGTMALIVVLSVFNGFEKLVISLFNTFNPDLVITVKEGKTFNSNEFPSEKVKNIPGVVYFTEVVEENALLKHKAKQHIVTIKGVSEDFEKMSRLDTMIIDGEFILKNEGRSFTVIGAGVAYYLGANPKDFTNPISVYIPKRTKSTSLNFENAFNNQLILPSGVFSVQQDFDINYIIVPLEFARELLEYNDEVTSIELGLEQDADTDEIQSEIQNILGEHFLVKNQFQQQELLYKIMKSEKLAIFLILSFILLIATFNVIGSLSMLILDKKKDIAVLSSMGANKKLIKRIFLIEGLLISVIGAILGLTFGGILCWLQQRFGIISLGPGDGSFVVDAYPVQTQILDFVYVFITVFLIGLAATLVPVKQISKKYLNQKLQ